MIDTTKFDGDTARLAGAHEHGLRLHLRERDGVTGAMRFYASFENCEVKRGALLHGTCGNGATRSLAIADYAAKISGQHLVVNAMSPERRRDIHVPAFTQVVPAGG